MKEAARALAEISDSELRERFEAMQQMNAQRMAEWVANYQRNRSDEDRRFDYLAYHFGQLTAFFQQAAEAGDAVLIEIV